MEEDDQSPNPLIVKCSTNTYFDYVGITQEAVVSKPLIVLSDRKMKARRLYTVVKSWINFKTGKITCPIPITPNITFSDIAINSLLKNQLSSTTQAVTVPFTNRKGETVQKQVKIRWETFNIRGLYAHFGNLDSADSSVHFTFIYTSLAYFCV